MRDPVLRGNTESQENRTQTSSSAFTWMFMGTHRCMYHTKFTHTEFHDTPYPCLHSPLSWRSGFPLRLLIILCLSWLSPHRWPWSHCLRRMGMPCVLLAITHGTVTGLDSFSEPSTDSCLHWSTVFTQGVFYLPHFSLHRRGKLSSKDHKTLILPSTLPLIAWSTASSQAGGGSTIDPKDHRVLRNGVSDEAV